jgi:hypothetical protein
VQSDVFHVDTLYFEQLDMTVVQRMATERYATRNPEMDTFGHSIALTCYTRKGMRRTTAIQECTWRGAIGT